VQLYLNNKLIGEKPTGVEQEFKALFDVSYEPGTLFPGDDLASAKTKSHRFIQLG
jgi:hypothetical protein